jgi:hypothetical protein
MQAATICRRNVCNKFIRNLRFLSSCYRTSLRPTSRISQRRISRRAVHLRESKQLGLSYLRGMSPKRSQNASRTYLPLTAILVGATRCGSWSWQTPVPIRQPRWPEARSARSARCWKLAHAHCRRPTGSARAPSWNISAVCTCAADEVHRNWIDTLIYQRLLATLDPSRP